MLNYVGLRIGKSAGRRIGRGPELELELSESERPKSLRCGGVISFSKKRDSYPLAIRPHQI